MVHILYQEAEATHVQGRNSLKEIMVETFINIVRRELKRNLITKFIPTLNSRIFPL